MKFLLKIWEKLKKQIFKNKTNFESWQNVEN